MPAPITHKEYKHLLKAAYGDSIRVISKIQGSLKPVKHKCNECDNVWNTAPSTLVSRKRSGVPLLKHGCPKCAKSASIKANTGRSGTTNISKEEGLRVLGFDPGTVNFGVAASTVYGTDSIERISVSEITMLENPMTDIAPDMYEQYAAFAAEIRSYIDTYDPHVIVVERFASRGLKGKTIELVGYMIGAIIAVVESYREKGKHIVLRPVMPASWKNQVNRVHDLDYLYKGFKTKKVVPHVVDAALMSLYAFPAKENPYLFLTNSAKRKQWIKSMLLASKL